MKRILLILFVLIGFGTLQAQDQPVIGPTKGAVTVSLLLGNASTYATSGLPTQLQTSYSVTSPSFVPSSGFNGLVNMLGVEGKWFFSNTWALRFNGASMLNAIPAYEGIPGVNYGGSLATVPTYTDVPARANAEVLVNMGVDKYFATKNSHLFWYASPVVNFQYGRKSGFEVSGVDPTSDPGTTRFTENFGIGLSGIAGVEYWATSGIVFGFELSGVRYMYVRNTILPGEGLGSWKSDSQNFSFLSQPTVKIGFRF